MERRRVEILAAKRFRSDRVLMLISLRETKIISSESRMDFSAPASPLYLKRCYLIQIRHSLCAEMI